MFHVKHEQVRDVGNWAGFETDPEQLSRLETLSDWLAGEALVAGGIGPDEAPHVWERHVLDSLMFGAGLEDPAWVLDVGTGVGLPGLPLAIVYPDVPFVLLDRSGRRVRLVRRIARILGVSNVEVIEADAHGWVESQDPLPCFVMRGVLQPEPLRGFASGHLAPGGSAVVGAGLEPAEVEGFELTRFPGSSVLEPGRWLRIMRQP